MTTPIRAQATLDAGTTPRNGIDIASRALLPSGASFENAAEAGWMREAGIAAQ